MKIVQPISKIKKSKLPGNLNPEVALPDVLVIANGDHSSLKLKPLIIVPELFLLVITVEFLLCSHHKAKAN